MGKGGETKDLMGRTNEFSLGKTDGLFGDKMGDRKFVIMFVNAGASTHLPLLSS